MIAILKYNAGNISSVQNALKRMGYESVISDDPEVLKKADKVIFPGVGEASSSMAYLRDKKLDEALLKLKQPVLGICLGMQLMCSYSEEGNTDCLGIFDSIVRKLPELDLVPHMGWNNYKSLKGPLFENVNRNDNTYYVHSYYAEICPQTTAICNYILPFACAMQKDNFYGTQFHPEKSAEIGEKILRNFLEL